MFQSYNHSRLYTVVNVFSSCFESVIVWGWLGDRFAAPISMIVIILKISIMSSLDLSVKQWYNNISQDYNKTAPSTEHNKCISIYIYIYVCVCVCGYDEKLFHVALSSGWLWIGPFVSITSDCLRLVPTQQSAITFHHGKIFFLLYVQRASQWSIDMSVFSQSCY